jgi:hypothetical protein
MKKQLSILMFLVMALGLLLTACGGSGNGDDGDDATATVQDLFKAIENKQFDKIPDYACTAQKDEVRQTFDFGSAIASSLGGADVDPQMILDALTFKLSGLEITEKSKSGDKAIVHAKGRLEMTVDPEKFKEVVRELLKQQGIGDVSDELMDQFAGPVLEQFEDFSTDLDDDIALIKEDGNWLICDE